MIDHKEKFLTYMAAHQYWCKFRTDLADIYKDEDGWYWVVVFKDDESE